MPRPRPDPTPEPSIAGDGPDEAGEPPRYTIDELAALTGVPSRTIRFYQSKGTLPAPERQGRVAYYRQEHADRLRIIAELQDRGLRLDAIRDALEEIERGGMSLQAWLGVGDQLQAPWIDDHPLVLREDELVERVGNQPGMIAELRRMDLIERQGDARPPTYVVRSWALLEIGLELAAAGIDPTVALEARDLMRSRLAPLSDELVAFFAERTGQGFGGRGHPDELAESLGVLRRQGIRAMQVIFAHEIERALRELVERGDALPSARRGRPGAPNGADGGTAGPAEAGSSSGSSSGAGAGIGAAANGTDRAGDRAPKGHALGDDDRS